MRKKILIINKKQFGYLTDTYKYCQYNDDLLDITLICFDSGYKKMKSDKTNIIYLSNKGNFLIRAIRFFTNSIKECKKGNYDVVFMVYFPMISLIKIFINTSSILDIRTGSIHSNAFIRNLHNKILKLESLFFDKISVISESLVDYLSLNKTKTEILPLGADFLSKTVKDMENLKLFYIGTFNNRNITDTLIGLSHFINLHPNVAITYDIVGYGEKYEEDLIKKTIHRNNLGNVVTFHGQKNHEECKYLFDMCNVGISYVPINDYYDCQPPTKTFEYLMSAMICIATKTKENSKIINSKNGVLCKDSPIDFSEALLEVFNKRTDFSYENTKQDYKKYSWSKIAKIFYKIIMNYAD